MKGFPWNWVPALGAKKTTEPIKKFGYISSRLDAIHEGDGQTPGDSKDRAYA